ncbi:plancitoxin-1-like [Genypterus blacodes]|uniref:plancitoxin-1-like n=1 Tax=Genypterus blacodes TaxID=154954 RepID=UPI003F765565
MWAGVLAVALLCGATEGQTTCRDNNNGQVDWFILYKAPKGGGRSGLEYMYIDHTGQTTMNAATPNYKPIDHSAGVLANTLQPLFTPTRRMRSNFGFVSYSDQPPGCSAGQNFGHSKGILLIEKGGTGIWLLHSTPRFPLHRHQDHFWPSTGEQNAQMFICVTFPYSQFQKIGKHLQHIQAFPFDYDVPPDFHQELLDAVNWVTEAPAAPYYQQLQSQGGLNFFSFSKLTSTAPKDGDLYYTIAKAIETDVYVQTWGCQRDRARSYCSFPNKVRNIKNIHTKVGTWTLKNDHSKWCVTIDQNKPFVCVGDMNRAVSQYQRTGGALCTKDENIRTIFKSFKDGSEQCDVPPPTIICSDDRTG